MAECAKANTLLMLPVALSWFLCARATVLRGQSLQKGTFSLPLPVYTGKVPERNTLRVAKDRQFPTMTSDSALSASDKSSSDNES